MFCAIRLGILLPDILIPGLRFISKFDLHKLTNVLNTSQIWQVQLLIVREIYLIRNNTGIYKNDFINDKLHQLVATSIKLVREIFKTRKGNCTQVYLLIMHSISKQIVAQADRNVTDRNRPRLHSPKSFSQLHFSLSLFVSYFTRLSCHVAHFKL